jgi:hypothetical protein
MAALCFSIRRANTGVDTAGLDLVSRSRTRVHIFLPPRPCMPYGRKRWTTTSCCPSSLRVMSQASMPPCFPCDTASRKIEPHPWADCH